MEKITEKMSAREFVWVHRLRQRIALEQIVLTIGNRKEKDRAKQFLDAMKQACPELLEDVEQYTLDLFDDSNKETLELFDEREYIPAKGRKTALKLPQDILWEERVIRRAVREYNYLFHPCEKTFQDAMKGLRYLHSLHPALFARARDRAIEQREQILSFEIYCKCNCISPQNCQPAESFNDTGQGRFEMTVKRIAKARSQSAIFEEGSSQEEWQFFLDRLNEVAPELFV